MEFLEEVKVEKKLDEGELTGVPGCWVGFDILCSRWLAEEILRTEHRYSCQLNEMKDIEQTFYLPPEIEYGTPRCILLRNSLESLKRAKSGLREAFCGLGGPEYFKTGLDVVKLTILGVNKESNENRLDDWQELEHTFNRYGKPTGELRQLIFKFEELLNN